MKMKRNIFSVLIAAVLAVVFAGCSNMVEELKVEEESTKFITPGSYTIGGVDYTITKTLVTKNGEDVGSVDSNGKITMSVSEDVTYDISVVKDGTLTLFEKSGATAKTYKGKFLFTGKTNTTLKNTADDSDTIQFTQNAEIAVIPEGTYEIDGTDYTISGSAVTKVSDGSGAGSVGSDGIVTVNKSDSETIKITVFDDLSVELLKTTTSDGETTKKFYKGAFEDSTATLKKDGTDSTDTVVIKKKAQSSGNGDGEGTGKTVVATYYAVGYNEEGTGSEAGKTWTGAISNGTATYFNGATSTELTYSGVTDDWTYSSVSGEETIPDQGDYTQTAESLFVNVQRYLRSTLTLYSDTTFDFTLYKRGKGVITYSGTYELSGTSLSLTYTAVSLEGEDYPEEATITLSNGNSELTYTYTYGEGAYVYNVTRTYSTTKGTLEGSGSGEGTGESGSGGTGTEEEEEEQEEDFSNWSGALTLRATQNGTTVTFKNRATGPVTYKINGGEAQTIAAGSSEEATTVEIPLNKNDRVEFFGNNKAYSYSDYQEFSNINCDKDCYVYGNFMSLIDSENFANATVLEENWALASLFRGNQHIKNHPTKEILLPATTLSENCYSHLFHDCDGITRAPELPATTLNEYCYQWMFAYTNITEAPELSSTELADCCYIDMFCGCASLSKAPELPATTLVYACYSHMFDSCTKLTEAPALPATTLASECYTNMFIGCSSLTKVELPATTLVRDCYAGMFMDCTSLNYIKCLATDISASSCIHSWISNVSESGTFVIDPSMADVFVAGQQGIPSGWTVKTVDEE